MSKETFEDIAAGLKDAIEIARGKADPATYRVHSRANDMDIPEPRTADDLLKDPDIVEDIKVTGAVMRAV